MMNSAKNSGIINHEGIVQRIDHLYCINILSRQDAVRSCNMSGKEEKIINGTADTMYFWRQGGNTNETIYGVRRIASRISASLVSVITVLIILVALQVPELPAGLLHPEFLYHIIISFFQEKG
jgi:hypothetical protein